MSDEPFYYREGRHVYRRPVDKIKDGVVVGSSMGFMVCVIDPWITEPQAVVDILNKGDPVNVI